MPPVKGRKQCSIQVVTKGKWTSGETFDFKKTPQKTKAPSSDTNMQKNKNRRQSMLLKHLEIDMLDKPSPSKSPGGPGPSVRRTRRMSMANIKTETISPKTTARKSMSTSKIPRSASDKPLPNKATKAPPAVKMIASPPTSRSKLPARGRPPKASKTKLETAVTSNSSGATVNVSDAKSSSSSASISKDESWIEQITSPKVFYKQTPSSPKLTGAIRRKSYSPATCVLQIELGTEGKKRKRKESPSPVKSKNACSSSGKKKTPVIKNSYKKESSTEQTIISLENAQLFLSDKLSPMVQNGSKSDMASVQTYPKSKIITRTPAQKNKLPGVTSKCNSSVMPDGRKLTSPKSLTPKNLKTSKPKKIEILQNKTSLSNSNAVLSMTTKAISPPTILSFESSPPLRRSSALTRSAARRRNASIVTSTKKSVTISGTSPVQTKTNYRVKTPKSETAQKTEKLREKSLVVAVQDIGSSAVLLKHYPAGSGTASPVKRVLSASRANPFTPKPEAQPSKLLKQNIKKKFTTEIKTLKKMSKQVDPFFLLDPRISSLKTPTRVMLQERGFVSGNTPVSSPTLPPTPPSAHSALRYANRSAKMVASARRKIPLNRERQTDYTPLVHSTPRPYSSYTNGNGTSLPDNSPPFPPPQHETMLSCKSSSMADFTNSVVDLEEQENSTNGVEKEVDIKDVSPADDVSGIHGESKKASKKGYCVVM